MAPSFFSKLVKSSSLSSNHSRSSSTASSPTVTSPSSRHPSISISPASSPTVPYEKRNGSAASAQSKPQSSGLTVAAGYESSDSGPNVTVIPPSPNVSENSIPLPEPHASNTIASNNYNTRPRTASNTTPGQHPITNESISADSSSEDAPYHKRLASLPAISSSAATASSPDSGLGTPGTQTAHTASSSSPAMSPSLSDDGLATPTPSGRTTFVPPVPPIPSNSSTSSNADGSMSSRSRNGSLSSKQQKQQQKQGQKQNFRSATVTEGAPQQQQHLQTPKELRHSSSNRSIRSRLSIMLPSRDTSHVSPQKSSRHDRSLSAPASPPANAENGPVLVESPTAVSHPTGDHPSIDRTITASNTLPSAGSTLLIPDNSDAVSISSVGSATSKKRRPWRRGSNASSKQPRSATIGLTPSSGSGKSPPRRGATAGGLASALAASGLAMANPGISLPPISPGPAESTSNGSVVATGRPRRSMDTPKTPPGPRSRATSLNYPASDYSDRDSFHSGQEAYSDEEGSSESDDLDLDPDDIPVTGFAVASNKRNQDFHELFPTVPEGDYLIEDYGCALQREILIQGRLYISENHVCFHANIFGWITDLSIPMSEVISLEKRMTAFVIPNAIQLSTRTAKYTFTSFLSRDTTFDVLYNVWRLARPENSSVGSLGMSPRGSLENGDVLSEFTSDGSPQPNGKTGVNGAAKAVPKKSKVTQCDCGRAGQHYPEVAMEAIFPGTPEKIYNLMFTSGFIKDFMRDSQKLIDIQISDWMPTENAQLLARNMTYIKPLNASIGPKQTKCELRDETVFCDFDKYVCMLTTTRTPEVPSGGVFSVKTRTCITWASNVTTRVLVTTQVEWTGRSFIKGIIEKSAIDGQKQYHADLEKSMRQYIHEHQSEFIPEGVDVAVVEEAESAQQAESPRSPTSYSPSDDEARKARESERNRRSLQWAYDTFEGAYTVARRSTEGALELIRDAWDQSSSTTILYFVIVFLVISNVWTLTRMGSREDVGRRKAMRKIEEREQWVQNVVTALWEELLATRGNVMAGGAPGTLGTGPVGPSSGPTARSFSGDWREELGQITAQLDIIEQRVRDIRESVSQIGQLDQLD
ncbi:hypothetical protein BD414DRAFT_492242 [Trametes punicea]|nr:hypothetical protein BD414DRAFT_492242 [Trametes punicea]